MNMRISIIFDCNQNQCVLLKNAMRHFTLLCSWLTLMSIWARADSIIICRCMERYNTSLLHTQQRWTISIFFPIWIYLTNVIGFITSVSQLKNAPYRQTEIERLLEFVRFGWFNCRLDIINTKSIRLNRNKIYLCKALANKDQGGSIWISQISWTYPTI